MTTADKEGTLHVVIFFNYREGQIQKRFTNFHAKGKKGGNGKSFILCTEKQFKTRILKETGEHSLKFNKQQMTSTTT